MPNYFSDYDTTVHFISQEELDRDHSKILRWICIKWMYRMEKRKQTYHRVHGLKLDSNQNLHQVFGAYARAAYKLSKEGQSGCKTVFDITASIFECEIRRRIKSFFVIKI